MILVHVYSVAQFGEPHEEIFRDSEIEKAVAYARNEWKKKTGGIYKIKVWTGTPIPNRVNPPGLYLELI